MADADGELPRANVRKLVKARLAELGADGDGRDVQINKDALAAFSEAAKIFIHYLTSTASDMCQETKRSTIIADDVLKAIGELDFGDLAPPLEAALETFRTQMAERNKKKAESMKATKKRKAEEAAAAAAEQEAGVQVAAAAEQGEAGGDAAGTVAQEAAMPAAEPETETDAEPVQAAAEPAPMET
eukprot:PRCOL_00006285-RA